MNGTARRQLRDPMTVPPHAPRALRILLVEDDDRFAQNARSTALFTNNTWHATDALDLTLGLRHTREKKTLDAVFTNPNGGIGGTAGLTNRGQVAAALAARGYKAGGFNLDRVQSGNGLSDGPSGIFPVDDTAFPGEFVDSFGLGAKTTLANGTLLINAALFHQTYSDFQLNSFLGTSYVVRAIPALASRGLDADLLWQPRASGLTLQGGLTYTDARYGDDLLPDADLALLPGARASFSPRWQASASAAQEWELGGSLVARFNVGAKYTSDYNSGSDLDTQKRQDAFTVVNARLGLGAVDSRWMVELWGQNLTDETHSQVGFDAPLQTGSWNAFLCAPQTYGITFRAMY